MATNNTTTNIFMTIMNDLTLGTVFIGGIAAMVLNTIFFASLLKHTELRQNCITLIGLTGCHIVTGFVHVVMSIQQTVTPPGTVMEPATVLYCWAIVYPSMPPFVFQSIPLLLTVIAVERLTGFAAPVWYRVHWNRRFAITMTCVPIGICILSITSQWIEALIIGKSTTKACGPIFDPIYFTFFHFGLNLVCGVVATFCISVAIHIGRRRLRGLPQNSGSEIARVQTQMRVTKCMLAVACIDVVCVVLPNVHMFLESHNLYHIPPEYGRITAVLFCLNSSLDIVAYVTLSKDFRSAVHDLFRRKDTVSPANAGAGTHKSNGV